MKEPPIVPHILKAEVEIVYDQEERLCRKIRDPMTQYKILLLQML